MHLCLLENLLVLDDEICGLAQGLGVLELLASKICAVDQHSVREVTLLGICLLILDKPSFRSLSCPTARARSLPVLTQFEMPLDVVQINEVALLALPLLSSVKSLVKVTRSVRLRQVHRIQVFCCLARRVLGLIVEHVIPGLV